MRVLIDTNLLVSALVYGGVPGRAYEAVVENDSLLTCKRLEDELRRVLVERFSWAEEVALTKVRSIFRTADTIPLKGVLHGICRDPKDEYLLECAQTGHADLLVTGDRDLLVLGQWQSTSIITARAYLDFLTV